MSLENTINQDLKTAMKAKDQVALRGIRAIKSAILLAKTDGSGKEIDDKREIQILQKLVKQRKDSLSIFEDQGREDLAKVEREEIEIISKYLPQQMSEDELKTAISALIAEVGAESMKDMGRVMGQASQRFAGKADGKMMAGIVKSLLS